MCGGVSADDWGSHYGTKLNLDLLLYDKTFHNTRADHKNVFTVRNFVDGQRDKQLRKYFYSAAELQKNVSPLQMYVLFACFILSWE